MQLQLHACKLNIYIARYIQYIVHNIHDKIVDTYYNIIIYNYIIIYIYIYSIIAQYLNHIHMYTNFISWRKWEEECMRQCVL